MCGLIRGGGCIRQGLGECLDWYCAVKGCLLVAGDCDAELIRRVRMA